jgi:hypothetical protein
MMPFEEFKRRWRGRVAGNMALAGATIRRSLAGAVLNDAIVGQAFMDIADSTDRLLKEIYDDLAPKMPEPAKPAVPAANGNGVARARV